MGSAYRRRLFLRYPQRGRRIAFHRSCRRPPLLSYLCRVPIDLRTELHFRVVSCLRMGKYQGNGGSWGEGAGAARDGRGGRQQEERRAGGHRATGRTREGEGRDWEEIGEKEEGGEGRGRVKTIHGEGTVKGEQKGRDRK